MIFDRVWFGRIEASQTLTETYDPFLVILSLSIAVFAGYTAFVVADRIHDNARRQARSIWIGAGAITIGIGIWAMHFIGMLALSLPVEVHYEAIPTFLSAMPAVLAGAAALLVLGGPLPSRVRLAGGGVLMGVGIGAMHYSGMLAIHAGVNIVYSPLKFVISIVVAVILSTAALRAKFHFASADGFSPLRRNLVGGAIFGVSVTSMHFLGMWAESFVPGAMPGHGHEGEFDSTTLVLFVSVITVLTLTLVGIAAEAERRIRRELARVALHDGLTGIPNRELLINRLLHALAYSRRYGTVVALLYLDLDKFKPINDSLGHQTGDEALRETARRLQRMVRVTDTVARIGGDEFAVVLHPVVDAEAAGIAASRIIKMVTEPISLGTDARSVDVSIGIALFPESGSGVTELMNLADEAMYRAKRLGGGRYEYAQPGLPRTEAGLADVVRPDASEPAFDNRA